MHQLYCLKGLSRQMISGIKLVSLDGSVFIQCTKTLYNFIFFLYSIIIFIEISIEFGRKQRLNSEKFETIVKTTFQIAAKIPGKTEPLALVHSIFIRKIHVE